QPAGPEEPDHPLPAPDDDPGSDISRRQGHRVQAEVRPPRGPGPALRRPAERGDPSAAAPAVRDVLLALLLHDGAACRPHDHRHRPAAVAAEPGAARRVHRPVQHAGGPRRPLLARRGHHLDLPVPAALPARETHAVSEHSKGHSSLGAYFGVFIALMIFTGLTVWAAYQHLGIWNTPVALGIATTKAVMVALIFMHLKSSPKLTALVVGTAILFLAILILVTASDYLTRAWLPIYGR